MSINNNFCLKKLQEVELNGGVYKIDIYQNIIYVGIKNILNIYSINKKSSENFYEFKLIRQCADFTLINDIYVLKESSPEEEEEKDKKDKNENKIINEIFMIYINQ